MSSPRFVLVVGGPRSTTGLLSWPNASVPRQLPDGAGLWFAWRLLGGNNRELGRSAAAYATRSSARSAAVAIGEAGDTLSAAVVLDAARGMWGWRLATQDHVHAVSARLYLRQRECQYSLRQFQESAAVAGLWDEPEPDEDQAPDARRTVIDLTGAVPRVLMLPDDAQAPDERPLAAGRRRLPPTPARTTRAREQAEQIRRRPSVWPSVPAPTAAWPH